MSASPELPALINVILTAGVSSITALAAIFITGMLTKRREHEADWRKLKLAQYQEYILALSGIGIGRDTPEAQRRYADAVNAMGLIASPAVLRALDAFVAENSSKNKDRELSRVVELTDQLVREMRKDIHPNRLAEREHVAFQLLVPPSQ